MISRPKALGPRPWLGPTGLPQRQNAGQVKGFPHHCDLFDWLGAAVSIELLLRMPLQLPLQLPLLLQLSSLNSSCRSIPISTPGLISCYF